MNTFDHRRLFGLCGLAALLGLAGGGAAWALLHLIRLLTNLALLHRWSWREADLAGLHRSPLVVLAAVAGGAVVALVARWAPVIRGHGIPEAMEAVLTRQSRVAPRTAVAKPVSAAVAIGTGGPFGAEGPIIVTGGALGSLAGQVLPVSPAERKALLAAGAAAGMAAIFGAPVAAVALAVELLLFELSARSLLPVVVAASVAGATHGALIDGGPVFPLPEVGTIGLDALPWFAGLGVLAGLVATGVCRGFFAVEDAYRRLPVPEAWHPVVGAAAWASLGLLDPRVLGIGFPTVRHVLAGDIGTWALLGLAVLKLVVWWLALGSGTSGGTLAPLLLIGGSFGGFVGAVASPLLPGGLAPSALAVAGMAAVFGASTRATFTAAVFLVELTGQLHLALPLLLACALADLVARGLLRESLMTEKLARRGLRVGLGYRVDVLDTARVADVMTRSVVTVGASATVGAARRTLRTSGHSAFPVLDDTSTRAPAPAAQPPMADRPPTADGHGVDHRRTAADGPAAADDRATGTGQAPDGRRATDGRAPDGRRPTGDRRARDDGRAADDRRATDGRRASDDGRATDSRRTDDGRAADDGRPTDGRRAGDGRAVDDGRATDGRRASDDRRATDGRRARGRGRVVGLVSRTDLLSDVDDATPVTEVASADVVTIGPGATALGALRRMLEEGVEHLPVLDDGRLVGICTRTDLLSVRRRHFEDERPQPGWRPLAKLRA